MLLFIMLASSHILSLLPEYTADHFNHFLIRNIDKNFVFHVLQFQSDVICNEVLKMKSERNVVSFTLNSFWCLVAC